MKLVKGIVIGTAVAAGVAMIYSSGMVNKRRWKRRGRHIVKKLRF